MKKVHFYLPATYAILLLALLRVESGSGGANIRSLFDAVWYSLVTLTTVGYGDLYPVTPAGKLIGLIFVLGSLGALGLLIGEMSARVRAFKENRKMGYHGTRFRNHIIILGWDDFAHSVTRQLLNADRKVAIVTNRKEEIDLIQEEMGTQAVFVLFADLKNIGLFDRLNIEQSAMIFINIAGDAEKLVATLNLRKAYPDSRFLVTLESRDLTDTFHAAGVSYVISKNEIASKITASYIFEPDAADFANDLLSSTRSDTHYDFQQFQVTQENPYLNRRYVEAFDELKREHNILLTGLCKVREGRRNLIKLPEDEVPIELGDYLIMIVNGRTEKIAEKIFKVAEGVV